MKLSSVALVVVAAAHAVAASDPTCAQGVISQDHTACCPKQCGQCGGKNCNSFPGGADNCCEHEASKHGSCADVDAPCSLAPGPSPTGVLRFANSYGDHMVLQAAPQQAVVWGMCGPAGCDGVELSLDNGTAIKTSKGGFDSTWIAKLPATKAGDAPHTLTLKDSSGNTTTTITDVLFGDVWVCSGQSNMAFLLENAFNGSFYVNDSSNYPLLRMFTSFKDKSSTPLFEQPKIEEAWSVSSPVAVSQDRQAGSNDDNWLYMSAVCYLYGQRIHAHTGNPVGLVNTNWGGTPVEFWMSSDAEESCNTSAKAVSGGAYNGMITPLLNMTIYGAIWYQGEANAEDPETEVDFQGLPMVRYGCTFPAMIADWRKKFHAGSLGETAADFPFGFVQLAPFGKDNGPAKLRWSQMAGYPSVPNAAMPNVFSAVAVDLTDRTSPYGNVHIRDKTSVAQRLAAAGISVAYGDSSQYWGGPVAASAKTVVSSETATSPRSSSSVQVKVAFSNTGPAGLDLANTTGWEVCVLGGAHNCSLSNAASPSAGIGDWAPATPSQPSAGEVQVEASLGGGWRLTGTETVLVRYGWAAIPFEYKQAGLYSKATSSVDAFPASPFVLVAQ